MIQPDLSEMLNEFIDTCDLIQEVTLKYFIR